MTALTDAITLLIEANAALRKRRALAKPERTLARAMAKAFTAEGRAFLSRLAYLKARFPEIRAGLSLESALPTRLRGVIADPSTLDGFRCWFARALWEAEPAAPDGIRSFAYGIENRIGVFAAGLYTERDLLAAFSTELAAYDESADEAEWAPLFDQAALETERLFTVPIDAAAATAIESGANAAILDMSPDISFDLKNPRAVDYLTNHGAAQVTRIRASTRAALRSILTQAADEGWSYQKTATEIRARYKHFSRERAKRIAVYELGSAYAEGTMLVARDLQDGGLVMVKKWLSANDGKVRPTHRENQAAGWIDLEATFPSGDGQPPSDSGCRCALLTQRKAGA